MAVTNRGKKWEIINSLWIIWSFTLVFNFIAFLIIGIKAKNRKWTILGIVFFILGFVIPSVFGQLSDEQMQSPLVTLVGYVVLISYVVGIILAFRYRKEYLIRRDTILNMNLEKHQENEFRNKIINEYKPNNVNKEEMENVKTEETISIDINSASQEELLKLPGINIIEAKKIQNYIQSNNGFNSLDEVFNVIQVKPHFEIQLRKYLKVEKKAKKKENNSRTRKIDI